MYGPTNLPQGKPLRKVTVPEIRDRKAHGPPIAMVTAYDFTMARLLDEAGRRHRPGGRFAGHGGARARQHAPRSRVDEICYHGRVGRARASARAHLVGDMPFMSFQVSPEQGDRERRQDDERGRLREREDRRRASRSPSTFAHGLDGHPGHGTRRARPAARARAGGFRVQGKTDEAAERIVADALALEQAGAFAVVLEAMPPRLPRGSRQARGHSDHRHRGRARLRWAGARLYRLARHVARAFTQVRQTLCRAGRRDRQRDARVHRRGTQRALPRREHEYESPEGAAATSPPHPTH